jgi:hypothetical protein
MTKHNTLMNEYIDKSVFQEITLGSNFWTGLEKEKCVIVAYEGVFNAESINAICQLIKQITDSATACEKKIYRIFVELAQNISQYSSNRSQELEENGVGSIIISDYEKHYMIISRNLIKSSEKEKLINLIRFINSLSIDELRELRRTQLEISDRRIENANMGFIKITFNASSEIEIITNPHSANYETLTLAVRVDK